MFFNLRNSFLNKNGLRCVYLLPNNNIDRNWLCFVDFIQKGIYKFLIKSQLASTLEGTMSKW